jgi:Fe-S cluster assembly protein SufB
VTKRAIAHEEAEVKWIDCNIGSRLTMKYPGVVLKAAKPRRSSFDRARQQWPAPGHRREDGSRRDETTSNIISKSISIGTGRATYRGLVTCRST